MRKHTDQSQPLTGCSPFYLFSIRRLFVTKQLNFLKFDLIINPKKCIQNILEGKEIQLQVIDLRVL